MFQMQKRKHHKMYLDSVLGSELGFMLAVWGGVSGEAAGQ